MITALRADRLVGNNKKLNCGPGSKPCGDACIPKNHKCRASWNKPVKALRAGAIVAGLGLAATAVFHPRSNMRQAARGLGEPALHAGFALGNAARGNLASAAKNVSNMMTTAGNAGSNLKTLGKGYGEDLGKLKNKATKAINSKLEINKKAKLTALKAVVMNKVKNNYKKQAKGLVPSAIKVGATKGAELSKNQAFSLIREAKRQATPSKARLRKLFKPRKDSVWAAGFEPNYQ